MSLSPAGLEYAARYTHTFRDGRTVDVISVNHANPADRSWAEERVTEMVRAQQALGRTVDAHLAVRRAATEWEPERLGPAEPEPGSEIPGQPGYVVGTCGHRLAGSEWRAGFRTCERCPDDAPAISADAAAHVLFHIGAGGWPGSTFVQQLLKAFETADGVHQALLGTGFPEYLAAVKAARGGGPGVEYLLSIVDQDGDA